VRGRGDHARLLDGHGGESIHAVDAKVETDAERQCIHTDDVLHDLVGRRRIEPTAREAASDLALGEANAARERAGTLIDREPVKAGDTRLVLHA
jgi:hypothetical protein